MLNNIVKAKRNNLHRRLHKPLAWWSNQTLSSVISITPPLSEDTPLWLHDDRSLSKMKLHGFSPNELNVKADNYRNKALWQRWVLRLFATPSYQQFKVWFYVQECLTFRETEQSLPLENPSRSLVTSYEQRVLENEWGLLKNLSVWFFQEEEKFKQSIKIRSNQWLNNHFIDELNAYERRRSEKFLKQLNIELKSFTDNNQKSEAYDKAQACYDEVGEIMRKHNILLFQNMRTPFSQRQHTRSNREEKLLSLVPSTQPTETEVTSLPLSVVNIDGWDQKSFISWLKDMRMHVGAVLEQEQSHSRDEQIKKLMSSNLKTLMVWVKQRLEDYESTVQKNLLYQDKDPNKILEDIKDIKSDLSYCFNQGNLLFHPDHFQAANNDLLIYWNELFICYKKFSDESIESLKESDALIAAKCSWEEKCYQALLRQNEKFLLELRKMAEERRRYKAEMDLRLAQLEEKIVQDWKEMKEEIKEQKEQMEGTMQDMKSQMQEMEKMLGLVVNKENGLVINDEESQASTSRAPFFNP